MIKKLLLIGCFLSLFTSLSAQTTLAPGDIAIIGTNYDVSPYEMTIINLVPISAGTVIRITDYGYDEATGTFGITSATNAAEGSITWTLTSAMPAGTVTKFSITGGATLNVSGLPGIVSVTGWSFLNPASCPIPSGGDNWFIFQGSSPTSVTTYVFAWTNTYATAFYLKNLPAGQFIPTGNGNEPNNSNSYLPPTLTLGTNAIALNRNPTDPIEPGYHGDNNVYNGIKTGTKAAILAEICNVTKWSHNETIAYDINPGGASFPGTNPIFNLSSPNTAPTNIALSANTINENVSANTAVGTLSATDADAGNTFTYTLAAGTGDTDNASFNISGSSLRISASPDFETKSSYSVRVRVADQGGLTFEKAFAITITNVNEAPSDIALSANTINENVSANTAVETLSSADADAGNTFTYTLAAGTGDTDNSAFTITGNSLTINASPDFETKSSYSVRVRVADQGGLTFEKVFAVTITNVNEAPSDIALSASAVNENVSANTAVGALSSTDPDAGNTFTYTLVAGTGDTDNASFSISGSDLQINASPDFEAKSSYSVRVRVADQGGLTFEQAFAISITNINEAPSDIALSASAVNENSGENAIVGILSSTDANAGSTFVYSLVSGTGDTDNASFTITGNTLTINSDADFETKNSYDIRIRTTNQDELSFEKQFTITINDLCELDNSVTQNSGVLTATLLEATYQWYSCSDNSPVGINSAIFTPTQLGDYKVNITLGGCTVTSTCITVATLGTASFETNSKLSIYPNPSQGIINIESDSDGDYQVVNQLGQILKTFKIEANTINTVELENLSESIYFIKDISHPKNKSYKLIIKK